MFFLMVSALLRVGAAARRFQRSITSMRGYPHPASARIYRRFLEAFDCGHEIEPQQMDGQVNRSAAALVFAGVVPFGPVVSSSTTPALIDTLTRMVSLSFSGRKSDHASSRDPADPALPARASPAASPEEQGEGSSLPHQIVSRVGNGRPEGGKARNIQHAKIAKPYQGVPSPRPQPSPALRGLRARGQRCALPDSGLRATRDIEITRATPAYGRARLNTVDYQRSCREKPGAKARH
ncbi:hypothetical protein [Xanthomonas albilineans]|uniref:hypothetical protein n=1 Tax=Xanthomonas albilineans TaxID=29447 RepID=UPI00193E12F5